MAKAKEPQDPAPAGPPADLDGAEAFDVNEVVQDLSNQIAELTVQLAASRSVIRGLRKQLVEKSKNAPPQE